MPEFVHLKLATERLKIGGTIAKFLSGTELKTMWELEEVLAVIFCIQVKIAAPHT